MKFIISVRHWLRFRMTTNNKGPKLATKIAKLVCVYCHVEMTSFTSHADWVEPVLNTLLVKWLVPSLFKNGQTYQSTVMWLGIMNRQVDNCSHCSGKGVSSQKSGTQNTKGYVNARTNIGQRSDKARYNRLSTIWLRAGNSPRQMKHFGAWKIPVKCTCIQQASHL